MSGRNSRVIRAAGAALVCALLIVGPASAVAASVGVPPAAAAATTQLSSPGTGSLESAATRAGATGRKVAVSLIGLALAVAAIVLAFKRDFKEAVGVLAIGLVAVLLASPAGLSVLQDTVTTLFGG